jgi:hypothetical protein
MMITNGAREIDLDSTTTATATATRTVRNVTTYAGSRTQYMIELRSIRALRSVRAPSALMGQVIEFSSLA